VKCIIDDGVVLSRPVEAPQARSPRRKDSTADPVAISRAISCLASSTVCRANETMPSDRAVPSPL
jgi:hypothetical protein